jgi:cyclopropane fatty-acyl-phospholipid synthase-like methyltransferase
METARRGPETGDAMSDSPVVYQPDDVPAIWDKVSRGYDYDAYARAPENQANLAALLDHIGDPTGKRIIEVGCGSGFTSLALARRGAHCALLDLSPDALAVARAGFAERGTIRPVRPGVEWWSYRALFRPR